MDTQIPLKDKYKISRAMYIAWALFDCLIATMTSGVYLAKLTSTVGISDGMTAILSTTTSLAGGFQIISIFLAHKTPVKRWIIPLELLFRLMLSGLYLIPFISLGGKEDITIFVILLVSCALREIVLPANSVWFMNLIETNKIGSFSSINMCISLVGSIVFTFTMSRVIDSFDARGDIEGAFVVLSACIFTLTLLCLVSLLIAREKPTKADKSVSILSEMKALLGNKRFVTYIVIMVTWNFISSCVTPFLSTYQIRELGFSMTLVSIYSMVGNGLRILFTYLFGRLSINRSLFVLLKIGYLAFLLSFGVIIFTVPQNGTVTFLIYTLLFQCATAATSIGHTIVYSIVKIKERTAALAIRSIISGLAAILATLAANPLFNYVRDTLGGEIFGITVYAQQVLAAVAIVLGIPFVAFLLSSHTKILNHPSDE